MLHLFSVWKQYGVLEILQHLELGFPFNPKFVIYKNYIAVHKFFSLFDFSFFMKIRMIIHNLL